MAKGKSVKTLEEKTILEKHTINEKFSLGNALIDLDNSIKLLKEMVKNQHDALEFLAKWYEENAENKVQVQKPKIELL